MDRLTVDEEKVTELRTLCQTNYPDFETPLPGSFLKHDDHVMWLDIFPMVVLWGHDNPDFFNGYCPEYFGDLVALSEGAYVIDRAPVDPLETPLPIWPDEEEEEDDEQQEQSRGDDNEQRQMGAGRRRRRRRHRHDHDHDLQEKQRALQRMLDRMADELKRAVTEKVRAQKPELLPDRC